MRMSQKLCVLAILLASVPAAAQQSWDGYWVGRDNHIFGGTVSFDVTGNRITKFVYHGEVACSNGFDTFLTSQAGYAINSIGSFTINAPSTASGTFGVTATGNFSASGTGSGSYTYTANANAIPGNPSCSGSAAATFSVTRQPRPPDGQSWDGYWVGRDDRIFGGTVSLDVTGNRITKFVYHGEVSCSNGFDTFLTSQTGYVIDSNGSFTIDAPSSASGTFGVVVTGHLATNGEGGGSYNYTANLNAIPGNPACSGSEGATFSVERDGGPPPAPGFSVAGILAVVGSAQGNGAFFRTGVQIHNPRSSAISGTLVFHPQGVSGGANDPSLTYTLNGGQTLEYQDLLPAMGLAGGLGSLDILTTGDPIPIMAARIFSDGGVNGTSGFFLDPLAPDAGLQAGDAGVIISPADPAKARLNLGIRSLETGATFQITVRNKNGAVRNTVSKSYGPNFFEQVSANAYVGLTLDGSDTISFAMTSGKAIIYGAQTDNKTQDPAVQYAKKAL